MFGILLKLIAFVFRAIKAIIYLFIPEEKRLQIKEEAKDGVATAGKFGFSLIGKIIIPVTAFFFISFASFIYALIPSVLDVSNTNATPKSTPSPQRVPLGQTPFVPAGTPFVPVEAAPSSSQTPFVPVEAPPKSTPLPLVTQTPFKPASEKRVPLDSGDSTPLPTPKQTQ